MLVTDIEISQYRYCPESLRHLANVRLSLRNQSVTLFCRLDLGSDVAPAARGAAFVAEATRQLLRMPEYRSGNQKLHFAEAIANDPVRLLA